MKHIGFAVIAAAALAVIGPRIAPGQTKEAAASAPHAPFAPSDYRAVTPHGHAAPEFPSMHFKR